MAVERVGDRTRANHDGGPSNHACVCATLIGVLRAWLRENKVVFSGKRVVVGGNRREHGIWSK